MPLDPKRFDIISIGDCTEDNLMEVPDAEVNCSIHPNRCLLCFSYADKIPASSLHIKSAGNANNNAVGSARLGMKAAIYTILGNDGVGIFIKNKLREAGVAQDYIVYDPKLRTNFSVVINYKGERTILVYHAKRKYKLPKLSKTKWLYYTSLGEKHAGLNRQIISFVKKNTVKLGYNPGTYQLRAGVKQMKPVLAVCEVVFVNKEEAARIVGPQHDVRHYLMALRKLGPKIVVVTDGVAGSYAFDGKQFWYMGILKTPVIERTGAGDAYATGFIAALHYEQTIREAMCWGTMNSSSVIMKYGPQDGLLTRSGIAKFQKKHKHVCAATF